MLISPPRTKPQKVRASVWAMKMLKPSSIQKLCAVRAWRSRAIATHTRTTIATSSDLHGRPRFIQIGKAGDAASAQALGCGSLASSELKCKSNRNYWVNLQPGNVVIDLLLLRLNLALYRRIGHRPACASRGIAHVSSQVERH